MHFYRQEHKRSDARTRKHTGARTRVQVQVQVHTPTRTHPHPHPHQSPQPRTHPVAHPSTHPRRQPWPEPQPEPEPHSQSYSRSRSHSHSHSRARTPSTGRTHALAQTTTGTGTGTHAFTRTSAARRPLHATHWAWNQRKRRIFGDHAHMQAYRRRAVRVSPAPQRGPSPLVTPHPERRVSRETRRRRKCASWETPSVERYRPDPRLRLPRKGDGGGTRREGDQHGVSRETPVGHGAPCTPHLRTREFGGRR